MNILTNRIFRFSASGFMFFALGWTFLDVHFATIAASACFATGGCMIGLIGIGGNAK